MQISTLLTNQFKSQIPSMHCYRLEALNDCTKSLITSKKLTLTELGRQIEGTAKPRSNIKRVDRILSNPRLIKELPQLYRVMATQSLVAGTRPLILVDWTCLSARRGHYLLRASTSIKGRSMVIYEEVHPKKHENNHKTHVAFLQKLSACMPSTVKPIIVTDAGFRALWFHEVIKLGYNFVGRIRNKNLIKFHDSEQWVMSSSTYASATSKAKELGTGLLTKANPLSCRFVSYKSEHKHRDNRTIKGKPRKDVMNKQYQKTNREPWLIASSLPTEIAKAVQLIKIYKKRMQIEEEIRDTKSSRYGFSLSLSETRCPIRMSVLLLIGALATFECWIAAIIAHSRNIAQDFQARSAKFASSISYVFLGRAVLLRRIRIRRVEYDDALQTFREMASKGVI